MHTHQVYSLHIPMFAARGLAGLGALTLAMDKQAYLVGETPTYMIQGGLPNAQIAWTSFKDGAATGEYQASYGQTLDAEGKAVIPAAGPWTADQVGLWEKTLIVLDPERPWNPPTAQFFFTVSSSSAAPAGSSGRDDSGSSFFDKSVSIFGQRIPVVGLIAVGGLLVFTGFRK